MIVISFLALLHYPAAIAFARLIQWTGFKLPVPGTQSGLKTLELFGREFISMK